MQRTWVYLLEPTHQLIAVYNSIKEIWRPLLAAKDTHCKHMETVHTNVHIKVVN